MTPVSMEIMEGKTSKYVTFNLGKETFALNILKVQEINLMEEVSITRIPKTPPFLKGVLNLRGRIVPVICFRLRLGLEEKGYDQHTRVIMAKMSKSLFGFIVDSISSVKELSGDKIEPPPSSLEGIDAEYIEGISKEGGEIITILNLGKIVPSSR